jgi:hypothetical protein
LSLDDLAGENQLGARRSGIRKASRSAKETMFDDPVEGGITHRSIDPVRIRAEQVHGVSPEDALSSVSMCVS